MTMLPLLLALLAAVPSAHAGELSYEEALQRALDANADLLKAEAGQRGAEGALLAARSTYDPQLTAGGSWASSRNESIREFGEVYSDFSNLSWNAALSQYLASGTTLSLETSGSQSSFRYELVGSGIVVESEEPQFSTDLQASVTQSLLQGFRTSYNLQGVRSAQRALSATELAAASTRQQVLADTAAAYWNLYQAQQVVRIAQQALEVATEEERVVHAKVEAGDLAPVESTRVAASVVQARSSLLEAENGLAAAAEALQLMVGTEPDGMVRASTLPAEPTAVRLDAAALVTEALEHNPDMQSLRIAEEGAELDLRDARHGRLPELTATGSVTLKGYETALGASYGELFTGRLPDWYIGTNLAVPLGNRGDRGSVVQREAEAAQARLDREAFERTLSQLVRTQARTVEQATLKLELAQANLALAEQTLQAERALQEAGRALQKDVLEAIKTVDDARVAVEQARVDHALALVELMRLRGKL